jgi:hypothetical protein
MPKRKAPKDTGGETNTQRSAFPPPDPEHLRRADRADAFIRDPEDGPAVAPDDLAESLAEEYLRAATSGEDMSDEALDQVVPEEIGGPFVETTGAEEFAAGTDASNPEDAEAEPLPRVVGGLARPAQDEGDESDEDDREP